MNSLRICFPFFIIALAATLAAQTSAPAPADASKAENSHDRDVASIIALEKRDADAAKVNDVDALVSLWTDDGVLLQPGAEPVIGRAAIRQLLQQQKEQTAVIVTLAYLENWKERRILGDEAYEWGEMTITARFPNGKEATRSVNAMRFLRRQEGSWKVARAVVSPGTAHELKRPLPLGMADMGDRRNCPFRG